MKKETSILLALSTTILLAVPMAHAGDSPSNIVVLTPEQIQWVPNPRVEGLGAAQILGKSKEAGPYIHRVRFPKGRIVQAHSHPDDRTYTVLSGTWYIGWGDVYDESKLTALPPGSFYTEPAGVPHFIATLDSETIVQVTGMGPTAATFVNPDHAQKKK
ncbi:MAG: cupin domain-containing protein [Gammaproteobacteria bacterium]|nr:cupin domain-containing protein [Gammaproteobacteria bacterium]MCB1873576.1 cupin domain-containing protein [Gammaproteobacteria bacterium]